MTTAILDELVSMYIRILSDPHVTSDSLDKANDVICIAIWSLQDLVKTRENSSQCIA
jgi:hypothetical protein